MCDPSTACPNVRDDPSTWLVIATRPVIDVLEGLAQAVRQSCRLKTSRGGRTADVEYILSIDFGESLASACDVEMVDRRQVVGQDEIHDLVWKFA